MLSGVLGPLLLGVFPFDDLKEIAHALGTPIRFRPRACNDIVRIALRADSATLTPPTNTAAKTEASAEMHGQRHLRE
jgi:hypothetical protein